MCLAVLTRYRLVTDGRTDALVCFVTVLSQRIGERDGVAMHLRVASEARSAVKRDSQPEKEEL